MLDPSEWTEDQKWTAIGMMWDFSAEQITMIRCLRAGQPRASVHATRQMMVRVREKWRIPLEDRQVPRLDAGPVPAGRM